MLAVTQSKTDSCLMALPRKRILIVDDEAPIRAAVQLCLQLSDHWEIFVAASGQEGLQTASVEQPDVILLDIIMPEMDGFAFLRKLRSHSPTQSIPVVLLTATVDRVTFMQIQPLGVVGIIAKPFQPLKLSGQILAALQSSGFPQDSPLD